MKTFSNSLKKIKKSIAGGGYACIVKSALLLISTLFLLTSCENFLDNKDVKDEILDSIAYNNAPECPVLFSTQDNIGSFLVTGRQNLKVGYKIQVQYTVNTSDYIFECLEAVSTDESQSRADYVTFETIKADEQKGIYVINVTLTQQKNDILIKPKCKLIPKIIKLEPALESSGCFQDMPVKISLNKALDPDSFAEHAFITVYSETDNLDEYFLDAYLMDSNKTVCIRPNDKHILDPNGDRNSMRIFVHYDFTDVLDTDKISVNQTGTYEYRIKKEFENQKTVKVYAKGEQGTTVSLNEGQSVDCVIGYATDITFSLNSNDYALAGFEAVSYSSPQTVLENVTVEAILVNESETEKTYKAHVWVKDGTDDVLALIKTVKLPAVERHTPEFSQIGVTTDKAINIYFNMAMKPSIINAVKLEIFGSDVANYFQTPDLSEDGKVLSITPKFNDLSDYIKDIMGSNFADIIVSFTEQAVAQIDQADYKLKKDSNSNFTVRYKNSPERQAPVKKDLFITGNEITLETAPFVKASNKFSQVSFNLSANATDTGIIQNTAGKKIYIYGRYQEEDSGLTVVSVKQKMLYAADGSKINDTTTETLYTEESPQISFITENGITSFCLEHTLQSAKLTDWVMQLDVCVLDACQNESSTESYIIFVKETMIASDPEHPEEFQLKPYNYKPKEYDLRDAGDNTFSVAEYNASLHTLKIQNSILNYDLYKNVKLTPSDVTVACEYPAYSGNVVPFNPYDPTSDLWELELEDITLAGTEFRILISAGSSIIDDCLFSFPGPNIYSKYACETGISSPIVLVENDQFGFRYPWLIRFDTPESQYGTIIGNDYGDLIMRNNYYYPYMMIERDGLFVELVDVEEYINHFWENTGDWDDENFDWEVFNIYIDSVSCVYNEATAYFDVTINLREDSWEKCDLIEYFLSYSFASGRFEKGNLSVTVQVAPGDLMNGSTVQIEGKKDCYWIYGANTKEIEAIDILETDKTAPQMQFYRWGLDQYKVDIQETINGIPGSGVSKLEYTIGETKHEVVVPNEDAPWELEEYIDSSAIFNASVESTRPGVVRETEITFKAWDKAGNVMTETVTVEFALNLHEREYPLDISQNDDSFLFSANIPKGDDYYPYNHNAETYYCSYDEYDSNLKIFGYYLAKEDGEYSWGAPKITYKNFATNNTSAEYIKYYKDCNKTDFSATKEGFCKFCEFIDNYGGSYELTPQYIYMGTAAKNTGTFDGVFNGGSTRSVMVSSDAPVYVRTVVTKQPYEVCSKWTEEEWNNPYLTETGLVVMDFDPDDHSPKRYNVPTRDLTSGDFYCVLACFADGTFDKSLVMQY